MKCLLLLLIISPLFFQSNIMVSYPDHMVSGSEYSIIIYNGNNYTINVNLNVHEDFELLTNSSLKIDAGEYGCFILVAPTITGSGSRVYVINLQIDDKQIPLEIKVVSPGLEFQLYICKLILLVASLLILMMSVDKVVDWFKKRKAKANRQRLRTIR